MKVELLVLIPGLENNWKQKGNFNFAIKISKKLLAFGITDCLFAASIMKQAN